MGPHLRSTTHQVSSSKTGRERDRLSVLISTRLKPLSRSVRGRASSMTAEA